MGKTLEQIIAESQESTRVKCPPTGPCDAKILIVGEAPGQDEIAACAPFVGVSGAEMTRMIHEVGILRSDCFITNVCKYRPPRNNIETWLNVKMRKLHPANKFPNEFIEEGLRELEDEIDKVKPNVIIAFGNTPLWALTGNWGITKWRGSSLTSRPIHGKQYKVIPTYHPAAVVRKWDWRFIVLHDLRKALRESHTCDYTLQPESFIVRPGYDEVMHTLDMLRCNLELDKIHIACDIETRAGHIACIGLAWSEASALCIPLMSVERPEGYWDLEEETEIVLMLRKVLTHPNARVSGQNWNYDAQYIAKFWGFEANLWRDTMTVHHSMFSTLPKGLDFLSSFYLDDHVYWKDEGKEWNPNQHNEEQLWIYNCRDCVRTWRIAEEQTATLSQMNFPVVQGETPAERQMKFHKPFLAGMMRGVRCDSKHKLKLAEQLWDAIAARQQFVNDILGHALNPRSPKQLIDLFYGDFAQRRILNFKTKRPTCNEEALDTIGQREVLLWPLTNAINEIRSLGTFQGVALQRLDHDGRFRCQYIIPGTITYRLSSQQDAFGFGTNLQNISKGNEDKADPDKTIFVTPNLRKMFVPDPGYVIGDFDLPQADAQVVAWEANDADLKELFRDPGRDLHNENCQLIFGLNSHKRPGKRQLSKAGVHLTNYGGSPHVLARTLGITVREAEAFQDKWFTAHPGIKDWHDRVLSSLQSRRYVENAFGYRCYFFGRIDQILKEALAWIPQSTVAIATNEGIYRVDNELSSRGVEFLLQVHDSAVFQWPNRSAVTMFKRIADVMTVEIPYPDPLVMPAGGKFSSKSWGECG